MTKDFRQEAVNLLLSSGRPLKRVAAEHDEMVKSTVAVKRGTPTSEAILKP